MTGEYLKTLCPTKSPGLLIQMVGRSELASHEGAA